jgi:hypothetical protein
MMNLYNIQFLGVLTVFSINSKFLHYLFVHFQFMLRSEVLRLYRDMLRVVRRVPDKNQQAELRQWIRTDFNNNKHHADEV